MIYLQFGERVTVPRMGLDEDFVFLVLHMKMILRREGEEVFDENLESNLIY